ncbi:MAG: TonB-dependent receptor, partial [Desulfobacterales bacterium]|nr:TonB-dependent receptor [Desulfobacterales bacterium]
LSMASQEFEASGFEITDNKGTTGDLAQDRKLDTYSVALEYEVNPLDSLGFTLGYGHHWLDRTDAGSDDEGSFLVGAYYDVLKDTRLRTSAAQKIRFPSIKQLYDTASGGNTELTTETSMNYELGFEQNLPMDSRLVVTGFWIDVDDYIEKDASGINQNNEEYRFKGIELTAETRYIKNLMLCAGYTWMDSEDRSAATLKDELQHRPEQKITLEASYEFSFGLTGYASLMHVADQYFYSDSDNKKALNDYTVVNLKLNQQIPNSGMSLYVGADNLFDEDYEESYGSPREGQTLYAGVEYRF